MIIFVLCSIDSLAYLCNGILPFLNIFFTEFGQRSKLKEDQLRIAANIYSAMKVCQCFDTLMTQCIMFNFAVSAFSFPVLTHNSQNAACWYGGSALCLKRVIEKMPHKFFLWVSVNKRIKILCINALYRT